MISWQRVQQSCQRSRGTQTDLWVRCITRKFNSIFLENWNQEHRKWKEYRTKNGGHESGAGDDENPPTWQKNLCLWNTHISNTHLCGAQTRKHDALYRMQQLKAWKWLNLQLLKDHQKPFKVLILCCETGLKYFSLIFVSGIYFHRGLEMVENNFLQYLRQKGQLRDRPKASLTDGRMMACLKLSSPWQHPRPRCTDGTSREHTAGFRWPITSEKVSKGSKSAKYLGNRKITVRGSDVRPYTCNVITYNCW